MKNLINSILTSSEHQASIKSSNTWHAALLKLTDYFNFLKNSTKFSDSEVPPSIFVLGIISYFESQDLKPSYRRVLYAHLRTIFTDAGYEDYSRFVPEVDYTDFKQRDVFTKLEMDILEKAECPNTQFKNTSIFMALTGLRRCDVKNGFGKTLEGNLLHYTATKTGREGVITLSDKAIQMFVENNFSPSSESTNHCAIYHREWLSNAGMDSKETPHIYRHCYASNELQRGANLHSISKDLWHNSIAQTLIYARLVSPGYTTVMVEKDGIQKSVGYLNTAYKRNLDLMLSHVDSDLIDTWFKEGTVNETPEGILTRSYKQDDYSISLIKNKNE